MFCLAVQADGKILAGGDFTTLGGQPRSRIGRLKPDGSLDAAFDPGADERVHCLAVQTDGKILVGGNFNTLGGQTRTCLGRLNADGSLDTNFDPEVLWIVYCLAVQADGKILVGGQFWSLGGQPRDCIGRLNPDGSLDTSFNPGADCFVYCFALQTDGKILVGGGFTALGGQARNRIGRLNADGSLDTSFNPGANRDVWSLAVQPDGKILVGGYFSSLGGQACNYLGRLNADGSLDAAFDPGADSIVYAVTVQADGKILVGGYFSTLGGQARDHLGRLNADGSLDTLFDPGESDIPTGLAVQADGKILVGGWFTTLGGQARGYLGRLTSEVPALQRLELDATGSTVTWHRSGACPEVHDVIFELSSLGSPYSMVGRGSRTSRGWELVGLDLPVGSAFSLRARAQMTGGGGMYWNGATGLVESERQFCLGRPNTAPQVSEFAHVQTDVDTATTAIAFTVGDNESDPAELTVSASTSNPDLVPRTGFEFGGSGAHRTLTITPNPGQRGVAGILVRVSDGRTVTETPFLLSVGVPPGDQNADGVVSLEELNQVIQSYRNVGP